MNGHIKITELDYTRLCNLISVARSDKGVETKNIDTLGLEIKRAKKVRPQKISPDIVTMNSKFEIIDTDTSKTMVFTLVYPADSDFRNGKLSVFSPLGSAVIGYKTGDEVSFEVPRGTKKVIIGKVLYQPEANGEYSI